MTEGSQPVAGEQASGAPLVSRAALLRGVRQKVDIVGIDVEQPRRGEVLVRMGATGVCQSDLSIYEGRLPNPLPMVLGHEGAGSVVAVGDGVTSVSPGDHVVLSWLAQCGHCYYCLAGQPSVCETANDAMLRGTLLDGTTRYSLDGSTVYHMAGLGTFSELCVVPEGAAVKVPQEIGFAQAALLGCSVLTGFGAAVNTGGVRPGESVAVIGCGGVGLNAVQGAKLSGASEIVAVDLHPERLELARQLGATYAVTPHDMLVKQIRGLTQGRGVDVAIEAAGRQESIRDALRMTRKGGRIVLVGAGPEEVRLNVSAFNGIVLTEKVIRGSFYGSSWAARDVERLTKLYASNQLKLAELVSQTFAFEELNDALSYCADERGARAVILFEDGGAA
ncbi:Zn-dependent alcohol dehydrogenase [Streptosporangium sp. NPDC087985]|uniref:Zn-dependent alcohol dehydrogenase n=1 Tax=Streptosporangium sp. NPDC087985 TaxID=3366196 RepID=UPI0037F4E7B6